MIIYSNAKAASFAAVLSSLALTLLVTQGCSPFRSSSSNSNGFSHVNFDSLRGNVSPDIVNILSCNQNGDLAIRSDFRKLTKRELENTYRDLLGSDFAAIESTFNSIPSSSLNIEEQKFDRLHTKEQSLGLFQTAKAVSALLMSNRNSLARFDACSSQQPITNNCAQNLILSLATKAFRRPVTATHPAISDILAQLSTQNPEAALGVAIAQVLLAPHFTMHIYEYSGDDGKVQALEPFSIANRISYSVTLGPPDNELWQAAASNNLSTSAQRKAQIRRLMQTDRGKQQVREFFNHYLQLDAVNTPPENPVFLNDIPADVIADLPKEAVSETLEYVDYTFNQQKMSFSQVMAGNEVFPRSPAMASIYGTAEVQNNQPQRTPMPRGLILRASQMFNDTENTDAINRGVHVRNHILCGHIPSPNFDAIQMRDEKKDLFDPMVHNNRDYVRIITSDAACMGCHRLINNLGYTMENFDALGRFTSMDRVFVQADYIATHPVNSTAEIIGIQADAQQSQTIQDGYDLVQELSISPRAKLCFTRQVFRRINLRKISGQDNADTCQVTYATSLMDDKKFSLKDSYIDIIERSVAYRRIGN